jgi:hypothetical protein
MADQQVKITISAIDNATKALNDVKNSLKGVSKETDNTQQSFFTLRNAVVGFASVALVSLGKQVIDVTRTFQELRGNIINAVGSVEKGTETFNALAQFASKTQFSIQELGRTFLTLSQNGVAPTDRLLKIFTQTAGNATNKVDALNDLTRLFARGAQGGFNIQSLNQLVANGIPAFQILREELGLDEKALVRLSNTAEGSQLILDNLLIGLEKRANNSVKPVDDLNVSFKRLFETFQAGLFQIGDQKQLTGFVDQLTELLKALQPIIDIITLFVRNILQGFILALETINPLIRLFSEIISDLFIPIKAVADNINKYLNKAFEKMAGFLDDVRKKYKELKEFIFGKPIQLEVIPPKTSATLEQETRTPVELSSTQKTVQALQVAAFDLKAQFKEIYSVIAQGMVAGIKDVSKAIAESIVLGKSLQASFADIARNLLVKIISGLIEEQLAKLALLALDEIAVLLGLKRLAIEKEITKERRKQIGDGVTDSNPEEMARKQLSNIIDELWTKLKSSFDTILTSVSDIFTNIGSYTDDIFNNIGSSIGDILSSLSSSVGDIFSSIGGSLGDIVGSMGNIFGGGGGGGFDLGSIFSSFDFGSFFMAEGGAVNAGTPYTVGERGREVFIPSSDGNIIPNQDLQSKANSFNFTIVATDVKGVKELLLDNRATIVNIMNQALNSKGKPSLI